MDRGTLKLILITSSTGKWIFPKGCVEENMSPEDTAVSEAFEEAGVRGRIVHKEAGRYRYSKGGRKCEVVLFPLEIKQLLKQWDESCYRARILSDYYMTMKLIGYASIRRIVKKLSRVLISDAARKQAGKK